MTSRKSDNNSEHVYGVALACIVTAVLTGLAGVATGHPWGILVGACAVTLVLVVVER